MSAIMRVSFASRQSRGFDGERQPVERATTRTAGLHRSGVSLAARQISPCTSHLAGPPGPSAVSACPRCPTSAVRAGRRRLPLRRERQPAQEQHDAGDRDADGTITPVADADIQGRRA